MAAGGSTKVVLIAFAGNFAIALCKLSAALYTGASAMFAEAIHSFVDSGNQLLLYYGLKRSERPADARHPFGYGREVYFWSFVVAILLFSLGAGVSIYEGIEKILHPEEISNPYVNYAVLIAALGFEGYAFHAALKEMDRRRRPGEGYLAYSRRSKDAALFTVFFEDLGALLGLAVALIGLIAAQALGMPELDGWVSVLIGAMLGFAAVFLAIETKALLIGEAAEPELQAEVSRLVGADPRITGVNEILSMHMGPSDVLLTLSLDFRDRESAGEVEAAITELETALKAAHPEVRRVFIEAQSRGAHLAAAAGAGDPPPA